MFKVRFHLGAGIHYKHWQIRTVCHDGGPDIVEYADPSQIQLELVTCVLKNNRKVAEKVLADQVRDVCGWVQCQHVIFSFSPKDFTPVDNLDRIVYDPKINPYWKMENSDDNYDLVRIDTIVTSGNRMFILKPYEALVAQEYQMTTEEEAVRKILTVLKSPMAAMCPSQVKEAHDCVAEHSITLEELIDTFVEMCWKT